MADPHQRSSDREIDGQSPIRVRNMGEPLRFENVEPLAGFSGAAARKGESVRLITRFSVTSDEPRFHRFVEGFSNAVHHMAQQNGVHVRLTDALTALLVLKPGNFAELWLDTAAVSLQCRVRRAVNAHTAIFEQDIADITGMTFPCVKFGDGDKVMCLFRQDWRFGFAFDMNPDACLDREGFSSTLGSLYRGMRYRHLYDAMRDEAIYSSLFNSGWFPFAELIGSEFKELLNCCEANFDLSEIEQGLIQKFDDHRLQRIRERWVAKPHFATRIALLDEALSAFLQERPIAAIKILLTEIEGILNDAYRNANEGRGARIKDLLSFAENSGERVAGAPDTLLFTSAFSAYLRNYTFANFDPTAQSGTAGSRHAVGHGAALADSYTMVRALQAILTVDQFAFFT